MVGCRDRGRTAALGGSLSEVSVAPIEQARQVVPVVSVQNRYNLTDREWEADPAYSEREGAGGALALVARRHETSPYPAALAWLLARSPATLVIAVPRRSPTCRRTSVGQIRLTSEDLEELGTD